MSYYDPVTRDFRQVDNKAAHAVWFESTEPSEGEPNHTKTTSTARLELIMGAMLARLMKDVIRNGIYAWQISRALPSRRNYIQPLGVADNGKDIK